MATRDATCSCGRLRLTADCGATVFYTLPTAPDVVAVPIGAFADPAFPPPTVSVYEARQHPWLVMATAMEHYD